MQTLQEHTSRASGYIHRKQRHDSGNLRVVILNLYTKYKNETNNIIDLFEDMLKPCKDRKYNFSVVELETVGKLLISRVEEYFNTNS